MITGRPGYGEEVGTTIFSPFSMREAVKMIAFLFLALWR